MPGAIDHLILAGLTFTNLVGLSCLMAYVKRTKERADERVRFLSLRVDVLTERADVQSSRADRLSDQVDLLIGGTGHSYRSRVVELKNGEVSADDEWRVKEAIQEAARRLEVEIPTGREE